MAEQFGLNDDLADAWGLGDDENAVQNPVTAPPIPGGQKAVTAYTPKQPLVMRAPQSPYEAESQKLHPEMWGSPYSPEELAAAKQGVDIDTKAPGRFGAGFGDPDYVFKNELTKKFGYTPEMRQGPVSGQIEYRLKGSNRWITTGKPVPVTDIGAGIGGTLGGVGGAVLGSASGGPVGTAFVGAGGAVLGSMAGRGLVNDLGKKFGYLPPDTGRLEGVREAGQDTTVGELTSFGLLGVGKGVKWMFRGSKPFTAAEATELVGAMKRADRLVNEISSGSGIEFRPTGYQIAAGKNSGIRGSLATGRAGAAQGFAETEPGTGELMHALGQKNEEALTGYFDNLIANQRLQGQNKQKATGEVADALFDPYETARQAAQAEIAKLPADIPEERAAQMIRTSIESAKKDWSNNVERPAWKDYNDMIGFNAQKFSSNIKIPWTEDARALQKQWRLENKAMKKQTGAVSEAQSPQLRIPKDEDATVDLSVLTSRIQDLKRDMRQAVSGKTGVQRDRYKYGKLLTELESMRDDYLDAWHPDVKTALDTAEGATRRGYQKFDNGLTRDMLVHGRDGQLRLTNGQTLMELLKSKDRESIRSFADNVKAYPQAKNEVNQMLLSIYRNNYTQNGIPTARKHAQFMKDYGKVFEEFFSPADQGVVNSLGGLGKVVGDEYTTLRKIMPGMKGSMGGDVETLSPESLVNNMFTNSWKPKQVEYALNSLSGYEYKGHVLDQWKAGVAEEMYKQLLDPQTGNVVLSKVNKILAGENSVKLEMLFNSGGGKEGTRMIKGLQTLSDAATLVKIKSVGGLSPKQATALSDLARITYARPLTREGVMVSALQRTRRRAAPEQIYKALTDPAEMERLTKQVERLKLQLGVTAVAGTLNAY